MKAYSYYFLFLFVYILFSCVQEENNKILIDLNIKQPSIEYSLFIDSVKEVTLKSKEDLFISRIDRLYVDEDLIFIEDRKNGVFVFSLAEKKLLRVIDYFGQGPVEFPDIIASSIDKRKKQILIFSYPPLYKYTYDGDFVEVVDNVGEFFRDFYPLADDEYLCLEPSDKRGHPSGVWLADKNLNVIKRLKDDVPKTEVFGTISTFYNYTDNGIYYYDRVWDDFTYITRDSVKPLYKFDFKQRVPSEDRINESPKNLEHYASIEYFAHSNRFILLNYFWFNRDPFTWVLLDKKENKTFVSNVLYNDISKSETSSNSLYYINNHTWCRVLEFEENNSDIRIEFLYIRQ